MSTNKSQSCRTLQFTDSCPTKTTISHCHPWEAIDGKHLAVPHLVCSCPKGTASGNKTVWWFQSPKRYLPNVSSPSILLKWTYLKSSTSGSDQISVARTIKGPMCGIVLAASNCCCLLVLGSRFFFSSVFFSVHPSFFLLLRYRFCVCTPRHQESPRIIIACHSPNSKASSSGALGSHSSGLVGSALWVQKENCSCWVHWFPLPNEAGFPLAVWVIIYYDHLWSMVYTILNFRWFTVVDHKS